MRQELKAERTEREQRQNRDHRHADERHDAAAHGKFEQRLIDVLDPAHDQRLSVSQLHVYPGDGSEASAGETVVKVARSPPRMA